MALFQHNGIVSTHHNVSIPNRVDWVESTPAYPAQNCMRTCIDVPMCGIVQHNTTGTTSRCTRFFIDDPTYKCYLKHTNLVINGSIGYLDNVTTNSLDDCKTNCNNEDLCIGVNFKEPNICVPIHAGLLTNDTFMWLQSKEELQRALPDPVPSESIANKASLYLLVCTIISWIATL